MLRWSKYYLYTNKGVDLLVIRCYTDNNESYQYYFLPMINLHLQVKRFNILGYKGDKAG